MNSVRVPRSLLLCLLLVSLSLPVFPVGAHAQDAVVVDDSSDTSFAGLYRVSGITSTGAGFDAAVIVRAVGSDIIQFNAEYDGMPVSTSGPAAWNGDDEVSVPLSVTIPFVASGSGTVVLTRAEGGWNLFASGSGRVLRTSGTATASGFGGGMAPTRVEVTEVTGVSETLQTLDEALSPLQPSEEQADVATDDRYAALALVLFMVFLWILLDLILGKPFFSGAR